MKPAHQGGPTIATEAQLGYRFILTEEVITIFVSSL
jgi:hypothetical protein